MNDFSKNEHDGSLISVVVPVFQEESTIGPFLDRMRPVLDPIGAYEILFCVDPGADQTVEIIEREASKDNRIGMLLFSRRFGQPAATLAGILNCSGKACAVIDVDLQDPPELIPEMLEKMNEGLEVVYAVRRSRKGETWMKRLVSWLGYKLIDAISDVPIPRNSGDFRIISRRVIEELRQLKESHGFLRGLVAFVGFPQGQVYYDRAERASGVSKYSQLTGSLKIGFNGIVAYSNRLLGLTLLFGFIIALLSFVAGLVMIFIKLFVEFNYPLGIPTITVLVLFLGGVQLMSIGIVGEYIGRIYDEVKQRPMYVIDRTKNVKKPDGVPQAFS